MNQKSVRFAYLVKEWGENYPPKKEFTDYLLEKSPELPSIRDFKKAVIWQVYGRPDSLYFKAFCYSLLSYLTYSNIMDYDILVYISPCFLKHKSITEAMRYCGVRFIEAKEIHEAKHYILTNFSEKYDKIMLIDCDVYLTADTNLATYWNSPYDLTADAISEEMKSWAVWPRLITTKINLTVDAYFDMIYEFFSDKYSKTEFEEATNYVGDWIAPGHIILDKTLFINEDFRKFIWFSITHNIKAEDLTLLLGAKLLKFSVGFNTIQTVSNPEAISPSIHLNGLTFDKHPEFASIFHKLLNIQ